MSLLVLTIDQRGSRRDEHDRVPDLINAIRSRLNEPGNDGNIHRDRLAIDFERTVGDEIQGALHVDDVSCFDTLPAILQTVVRTGAWWVGLGVGTGSLGKSASASTGPAFWAAREAVDAAKKPLNAESGTAVSWRLTDEKRSRHIALRWTSLPGAGPGTVKRVLDFEAQSVGALWRAWRVTDALLASYAELLLGQTPAGREAVDAVRIERSQTRAAERLGVTQQAISSRLTAARWRTAGQVETALGLACQQLAVSVDDLESDA